MDLLVGLDEALTLASHRVAAITPDEWDLPTPCREWTVGRVANHLVNDVVLYDALLTGTYSPELHQRVVATPRAPVTISPIEDLAQLGYEGAAPFRELFHDVGFTKPPETDEPLGSSAQARLLHLFGRRPGLVGDAGLDPTTSTV